MRRIPVLFNAINLCHGALQSSKRSRLLLVLVRPRTIQAQAFKALRRNDISYALSVILYMIYGTHAFARDFFVGPVVEGEVSIPFLDQLSFDKNGLRTSRRIYRLFSPDPLSFAESPPPGAQIWKNFGSLMSSGKVTGGDRIFLLDGYHGQILVRDKKFTSTVTIAPAAGAVAHADSVLVINSSNVHIQGLKVWPRSSNAGNGALVRTYSSASNIAFTGLDVRGIATAGNYSSWTATDWNNYQRTGFQVDGPNITVARSRVTGIFNGIIMLGKNALLEANIVDGFSGDGMRALGDNSVVRGNKVQNCHQVNASHTDAFQAWTNGPTGKVGTGTLRNLIIEDNKIFEFVGTRSPIACKLQGISLFAGVYDNFVIRNNVVSTTAYHGITIAGGQNSQIVNNTVIHAFGTAGVYPWIRVSGNRDGRPSLNMTVANNMTTSMKVKADPTKGIVAANNVVVTSASAEFAGLSQQDFNLRSGSKGVDAGAAALAPKDDIVGAARPKGKAPDAGAYENF